MEQPTSKSKLSLNVDKVLNSFDDLLSGPRPARIVAGVITVAVTLFLAGFAIYEKMEGRKVEKRHVQIEKVTFFQGSGMESDANGDLWLNDLIVKGDRYYKLQPNVGGKGQDVIIAVGFLVSDFEKDESGNFDVDGEVDVSLGTLKDTGELPPTHDSSYMTGRPVIQHLNGKNPQKIKQVFGSLDNKILYLHIFSDFNPAVLSPGSHGFRIVIRDRRNSTFAESKEILIFH